MNKRTHHRREQGIIAAAVILLAIVVALGTILVGGNSQTATPLAPSQPPPVVEPVALMPISADDAREANNEQPFVEGTLAAANPFHFGGDSAASARATDCLAAAVLYEAGDDADGQRAVAQVVLNRVRHPAFPKTVCGVVFQGSERATGCQFTFTCDGALARRYSDAAWQRARGIATDALTGAVYRPVGLATHYHTNWVRPYWSPSMDKLAQVGTHLFFRWQGYWGTPGAYRGNGTGLEPLVSRLGAIALSHRGADAAADGNALAPVMVDEAKARAAVAAVVQRQDRMLGDTILLTLARGETPDSFPAIAEMACADRPYCKVMGWTNPQLMPESENMNDMARRSMSFSYLRDQQRGLERALWNCEEFRRDQPTQCMRR